MPEDFLVSALRQILVGLKTAHQLGALHSDLKPANIFVKEDGSVLVGDFGCAIILHSSQDRVQKGEYGTCGYVSPE